MEEGKDWVGWSGSSACVVAASHSLRLKARAR